MGIINKLFGPNIDVEALYDHWDLSGLFNALEEGNTKARTLSVNYIDKILEYYEDRTGNEFKEYLLEQFDSEDVKKIESDFLLPIPLEKLIDIVRNDYDRHARFEFIIQGIYLRLLEHLILDNSLYDVRPQCHETLKNRAIFKPYFNIIWDKVLRGDFENIPLTLFPFRVEIGIPRILYDNYPDQFFREKCHISRVNHKRIVQNDRWSRKKENLNTIFALDTLDYRRIY